LRLGVCPCLDERVDGPLAAQALGDVVGGTERQDGQRQPAPGQHLCGGGDGPIAACGDDQLGMALENLLGAVVLRDDVHDPVAVALEQRRDFVVRGTVTSLLVVEKCDLHEYPEVRRFKFRAGP